MSKKEEMKKTEMAEAFGDPKAWAKERMNELVTVTRGQLDEVVQALYEIHTIGAFLDFSTLSAGNGERAAIEALHEADTLCEPISDMARLLREKAYAVVDAIGKIEAGKTVGHKEV